MVVNHIIKAHNEQMSCKKLVKQARPHTNTETETNTESERVSERERGRQLTAGRLQTTRRQYKLQKPR